MLRVFHLHGLHFGPVREIMPSAMPSAPSFIEFRQTACRLAQLGADTIRPYFGQVRASRKHDNTPVTEADHAGQAAILREVARLFPDHAVLTEEVIARPDAHATLERARWCWVIDPLDGTRNFARGVQMYAVSIGLLEAGRPVAAAVYDAASDCVWSAALGEGAFRGEAPLRLDDRTVGADSTIAVSSFRRTPVPRPVKAWMDEFLFRNLGAVALHLAWVAGGLMDAAFSLECKLWDIAAGCLLISEAGGIAGAVGAGPLWPIDIATYNGEDMPILAGTPAIYRRLVQTLGS